MSDCNDHIDHTDTIALAGRAFRSGSLMVACFIGGLLCLVGVYAAIVLLGGFLVRVINRFSP